MVFHSGDEHLVAGTKEAPAIALSDKVDGISGAPGEDHFVRCRSIDELSDLDSRCVKGGTGLATQMVHTTVNVGVLPAVEAENGVDDCYRLLCGGCIVEVDQRVTMYLLLQNGKILPDSVDVERLAYRQVQVRASDHWLSNNASTHRAPRRSRSNRSSSFRTGSKLTSAITSAANAYVSSRWASAAGMPRLRE